jgi:DNA-binding winged helix-turn-helix (wHTH) protein
MNHKANFTLREEDPFHLGDWLVEPMLNRVSLNDACVQLEHRVMAVLVCLAEHAGEVVTRRDLVDSVWDEGFVADNTITHAVTELRKAFGDDARDPRFIETIHRKGYRLVAPVFTEHPSRVTRSVGHHAYLAVVKDLEILLEEGENLIGRSPDVTITIPSMKVSRHHARITIAGSNASICDLESKNGTYLNGSKIDREWPLESGDVIGVGSATEFIKFFDALGGVTTEPEYDT